MLGTHFNPSLYFVSILLLDTYALKFIPRVYCIIPHSWGVIVVYIRLIIYVHVEANEGIHKLFVLSLIKGGFPLEVAGDQ